MLPHAQIKSKVGGSGVGQHHAPPSIGVFSDASTNKWAEFCTLCHHLPHITGTQRSPKGAIRRSPRPLESHPSPNHPIPAQPSPAQHPHPGLPVTAQWDGCHSQAHTPRAGTLQPLGKNHCQLLRPTSCVEGGLEARHNDLHFASVLWLKTQK